MHQPPNTHVAELNIGRLVADPTDPAVHDFVSALDRINGIGQRSPGFVWMMQGSGNPGTGNMENCLDEDPRQIANLTVWETVSDLETFVFNTVHKQFFNRRSEWFDLMDEHHFVMWFVDVGHQPTLDEAMERLEHLRVHGPGEHAFTWSGLRPTKTQPSPDRVEGMA